MAIKLEVFDDFHVHGASAPEWQQRYRQLSRGRMRSSLTEATSGTVHVFRKWMSERVVQQGCLPADKICFALLGSNVDGMARAQGSLLREDNLFVLHGGEEFSLQRPNGMDLMAVTFEAEEFRKLLDERPWVAQARALLSRSVLQAPLPLIWRLRQDLLTVLTRPPMLHTPETASTAARAVFETLTSLFRQASDSKQSAGSASASHIVAECHHLVAVSAQAPPGIDALCLHLGTSRRTLQNSFRQVADTTPVDYLRSLRLNEVRERLMATGPAELSVSQAATDQGFDHMSHFTERYKSLFEELPSRTTRKGATRRALADRLGLPPWTRGLTPPSEDRVVAGRREHRRDGQGSS